MRPSKTIAIAPPKDQMGPDPDLWEIVIPTEWMKSFEGVKLRKDGGGWREIVDYACDPYDVDFPFKTQADYLVWKENLESRGIWAPDLSEGDEIGMMSDRVEWLKNEYGFEWDWRVIYDRNSFALRGGQPIYGNFGKNSNHELLRIDAEDSIKIAFDPEEPKSVYFPKGLYYIRKHNIMQAGNCINITKNKIFELLQTK